MKDSSLPTRKLKLETMIIYQPAVRAYELFMEYFKANYIELYNKYYLCIEMDPATVRKMKVGNSIEISPIARQVLKQIIEEHNCAIYS